MKKIFTRQYLIISILILLNSIVNAQQVYEYNFLNSFDEEISQAPPLNVLGTGSFSNGQLSELSCLERPVYNFDQNSGFQFDNTASGNLITESYSVEMYFQFANNTGFRRIIDFKNRTSDFGLYSTASVLQFYDAITINTSALIAGQFVHLVVTRDSASQVVNMYVDGALAGSFVDATGLGLLDADNVMNFFQDDLVFGGEAQPGTISMLKLYDQPIDNAAVAANFSTLKSESMILGFQSSATAACLNNNQFDFTNTSQTSSAVTYMWDFGDLNTAAGTDAFYSYSAAGVYDVTLTADNGSGCSDFVTTTIEVYAQPVIDLGPDLSICDGDSVVLDAGAGLFTYLWNDNAVTQTITAYTSGIYVATITDGNNCSTSDSLMLDVLAPVQFTLGPDITVCYGLSVLLAAPPQNSYLWSTNDTTEFISVSTSGIYAVQVTNAAGCVSADTIEVTVNPQLTVSLGPDTASCDGNTILLDPGVFVPEYLWSDLSSGPFLDVTVSGTYAVTITDIFGCTATDSIDVIFNPLPVVNLGPDAFICGGTQFTIDAGSGFSGYLWSDGSQNQTLDITTAGLYSVIVTDANGCAGTDDIILGILPSVSLGADINLCDGATATLDPGTGFNSYLWDDGSVTQTIDVLVSGTYTVTVTDVNGCENSDMITVNFVPLANVNLGNDLMFCSGSSALLDAGPGFASYLWEDGSLNQTHVVSQSGTYMVTVTNIGGCSDTDTISVTVNPSPIVSLGNDTTVCAGSQVTLDAGPGFSSYQWLGGSSQQTLVVTSTNNYFVLVTDANGCSGSDDIDVIFNAPVPVPTITQVSNTMYSSSPTGNQWYSNPGGLIAGATDSSYSPGQNGTYYVIVTDANGCESLPSSDFIFVFSKIDEHAAMPFVLFPNPASGQITIQTAIQNEDVTVDIHDIAGKVVMHTMISASGRLDVSGLRSGSYMVRVSFGNSNSIQRLVITH
jgi:hypothetical protein